MRDAIGKNSYEWMKAYWNDRDMVKHFVKAYQELLERPKDLQSVRFDITDKKAMWFAQGLDDVIWKARKSKYYSWTRRSWSIFRKLLRNVTLKLNHLKSRTLLR